MPLKFDWQEEGEVPWGRPTDEVRSAHPPSRLRSRLVVGGVLLALLLGLTLAFHFLDRSAAASAVRARADLLVIGELILGADGRGDSGLVDNYLSRHDPGWAKTQRELAERQALFDRRAFGLHRQLTSGPFPQAGLALPTGPGIEVTALSSDLTRAEVTFRQAYAVDDGRSTDPVVLSQTLVYQRIGGRWLNVPPPRGFWGERRERNIGRVWLSYPARDEAIAGRVVADLDAIVEQACGELLDLACPPNLALDVRWLTDPATLVDPAHPERIGTGVVSLSLATASLVGLPQDEAGQEALSRGYAIQVVSALLQDLAGWQCCQKVLFFQALVDRQLSQLGLRAWPLDSTELEAMVFGPVQSITELHGAWRSGSAPRLSDPLWRQVYSLVDFILAQDPGMTATAVQRSLLAHDDYWPWLTEHGISIFGFEAHRQWLRFVQGQLSERTAASLPAQDLLLLCTSGIRHEGSIYRYDLAAGALVPELANRDFQVMHPLPDDRGVFLQERTASNRFLASLWRNARELPVLNQPADAAFYPLATWDSEMAFHGFDRKQRGTIYGRLALEACDQDGCPVMVLEGAPVWSPGGRRTLLVAGDGMVWLGDRAGTPLAAVAPGAAPFWLDDETYGYLRTGASPALVFGGTGTPPAYEPIGLDVLTQALRQEGDGQGLTVHGVAASPRDGRTLLIAATAGQDALVLSLDLVSGRAEPVMQLQQGFDSFAPLRFSPDGRWLAVREPQSPGGTWQLHLHRLATGQTMILSSNLSHASPGFDWSADGRWLVLVADGYLQLIAPEGGRRQLLIHDYPACPAAAWTAPGDQGAAPR